MLYLNPNTPKIIKAKRAFYQGMLPFVLARIDKCYRRSGKSSDVIRRLFHLHVMGILDDILVGEPSRLVSINAYLKPFIDHIPDFKIAIEYVFNYDVFVKRTKTRFDAYQLADLLDIRTCTYCNRNYTNTVIKENGKKISRAQFDHYFDKDTHSVLAISFYNLIPSCSICNTSIKGTRKMSLLDYTHPYLDDALDQITFTYKYSHLSKNGLQVKLKVLNPSIAKNTIDAFAIEEMYNSHTIELLDLLKIKQYYSDRYLSILEANLLKHVILSREELYRMVFGTEYHEQNFINRPLSKFKSDILKELGVI